MANPTVDDFFWYNKQLLTDAHPPFIQAPETRARKSASYLPPKELRKCELSELEESIDRSLMDSLSVLCQAVPGNTYAIFLASQFGAFQLRVWRTKSISFIPRATIFPGQGLPGKILNEGVPSILENCLTDSYKQLGYYRAYEKVRSLAGVPIIVQGARKGALVLDSLEPWAYSPDTISLLEGFASVIGRFLEASYTALEIRWKNRQLNGQSEYQHKFLESMREEEIFNHVKEYIERNFEVDRLMLIGRKRESPQEARVLLCKGADEDYFNGLEFSVAEKGLISSVLENGRIQNLSFAKCGHVVRLRAGERQNDSLKSLLAVPIRTGPKVVTHALMVESARFPWFSSHEKDLLNNISISMGVALARAQLYHEKEQMARKDGLTGIFNHKTFQEEYQQEIRRSLRKPIDIAVLMMDIDHFKQVNDTYGHPAGDVVLQETARIISALVRSGTDVVARYGGEEFVCMLIDLTAGAVRDTAERIRKTIEANVFSAGANQALSVTISIGCAIYPKDSQEGRNVLKMADDALYKAKKGGRNRVVFYEK